MKAIESENPDPETRIGTACIGRSVTSLQLYDNRNFEGCQGFFYTLKGGFFNSPINNMLRQRFTSYTVAVTIKLMNIVPYPAATIKEFLRFFMSWKIITVVSVRAAIAIAGRGFFGDC